MPINTINIPRDLNEFEVELIYLQFPYTNSYLYYIQASRSQNLKCYEEMYRIPYQENLKSTISSFLKLFDTYDNFDAIVSVPSSTNFQGPYFKEIKAKYSNAIDLSSCFSKPPNFSSGTSKNYIDVFNNINFNLNIQIDNKEFKNILIIDDFLDIGKTVAAMLQKLYDNRFSFINHYVACILFNESTNNTNLNSL